MAFLAAIPAIAGAVGASAVPAAGMAAGSVAALSAAAPVAAGISAGTLLSAAATGASLLGTGLSVVSQARAGEAEATALQANAEISRQEAAQRSLATQEDTLKISRAARQTMGEQITGYAGAGVTEAGTPLEVMMNTARNYERDIIMTGYAGDVGAARKVNEAKVYDWGATQKKKAGYLGAGTTLLTGLGKYAYGAMGSKGYFAKV